MVRALAYAVSTALDPEDRRAWERDLVTFYLDALAGTGAFVSSFEQTLQSKGAHLSTGITCPLLDRNRHDRLGRDHVVHRASVAAAVAFPHRPSSALLHFQCCCQVRLFGVVE